MNSSSDSNGRKKRVVSGTGSVKRRSDTPVQTNGPVGKKDGYQGRREQFFGQKPNGSQSTTQQSGSVFTTPQQSAQQNTQQNTQNVFAQQNAQSGTPRASGSGKLIRLLLIVGVIVVLLLLFRTCVCGGCRSLSATDVGSGLDIGSLFGGDTGSNTETDIGSLIGSDTGDTGTVDQSGGQDISSLLSQFLNTDYDAADSDAPAAVTASTSYESADTTVSNKARARYTTIKGNGKDDVTIMIYICGSDLESENGMATADINEMLHANLNDEHVNIIIETGGAKKWNNSVISAKTNQRYRVTSKGLQVLDRDVGKKSMIDPNTLVDFIKFCAKNYPANRNFLIMWDHGGGSISGFGYDQSYSGTMTLDKINNALKKGGVKFDFVGFDACLMGTLETAVVTEPYADYLIASEEAEPGCGWYYTDWLSELSKNPSISTVELSKTLIDDFNNVCKRNYPGCNTTLSIVDLAEFAGTVPEAFNAFSGELSGMLDASEYKQVADARANAREFGTSAKVNHIDLIDFANQIGTSKANAFVKALKGCIKYNRTSVSMKNSNGLSIYFPYSSFKSMNSAVALYDSIGMDADYARCIKSFASLAAGGQIATAGQSSPFGSLFGGYESGASSYSSSDILSTLLGGSSGSGDLLSSLFGGSAPATSSGDFLGSILGGDSYGWFDSGRVLRSGEQYDQNTLTVADMELTEKDDGSWVLALDDAKWALVENVQLNVFVKDGDGYIDLGMDDIYTIENGELLFDFDNTWLSLDGNVVAYYLIGNVKDGDNWATVGRVPAMINDVRYDLIIVFDNETKGHEDGYVAGAQRVYDNGETENVAKGFTPLKKGDKIDFLCDYYGEDGTYQNSYYLGDAVTFDGELTVGYIDLGGAVCDVTYCLTDLYHNEFWTETLTFE